MSAYGMDIDKARKLAGFVKLHADDVNALAAQIQKRIDELDWFGPDAEKFRAESLPRLSQNLKAIGTAAVGLADESERNARDQEDVSRQ